eukprot:11878-Heterococcus_DN1.PRE.2
MESESLQILPEKYRRDLLNEIALAYMPEPGSDPKRQWQPSTTFKAYPSVNNNKSWFMSSIRPLVSR